MSYAFIGRALFGFKSAFLKRQSHNSIPAKATAYTTPSAPIGPLADSRAYAGAKVHFAAQPTIFRQVRKKDKTVLERLSPTTLKALYGNKAWGEPKPQNVTGSFHIVG